MRLQTAQRFQIPTISRSNFQRANIMLKLCKLAESPRPKTEGDDLEDELNIDEIYQLLSCAMDRPPAAGWLDDW
jgi:hypothetical protein